MDKKNIAIDLGTTNSVVSYWNDTLETPEIIYLSGVSRSDSKKTTLDDSYTIPSNLFLLKPAKKLPFPINLFLGSSKKRTKGLIGMEAIRKDGGAFSQPYIKGFKRQLGRNRFSIITKLGKTVYNAEDAARIFCSTLIGKIKQLEKIKPSSLTFCVPVDYYEFYRASLKKITHQIGIHKFKAVDEPVAAAIGYGLNIEEEKNIMVIDFGGGTLDIAVIRTHEKTGKTGRCSIIAKEGAPIGGNLVDAWIVEDLCSKQKYDFSSFSSDAELSWWYKILLNEACNLKESLFIQEIVTFYLLPSGIMNKYSYKLQSPEIRKPLDYSREDLVKLLENKNLYRDLSKLISSALDYASEKGVSKKDISDVIMVGGSTLLPGIYKTVEKLFGRSQVKAWQPFNAVAYGAAAFASKKISSSDYIFHDYSFLTYNRKTLEPEHNIIIPKGTVFPTNENFWCKHLSPTCALGEPEDIFKLIIYELGTKHSGGEEFVWDEKGKLHTLSDESESKVLAIPLNETNPTLGHLSPPHMPEDRSSRLEVSFMVNEDKWLCTTVYDLKTEKHLLRKKPVLRLS